MPKLRYQGTEPVYVSALDRLVDVDEVVDVPDELVHDPDNPTNDDGELVGLVWPESQWAEVTSTPPKTPKTVETKPVAGTTREG